MNADAAELPDRIDETRITYPETEHGFTIEGNAFICEFDDPVDPENFCTTVSNPDKPWQTWGIRSVLSDNYWKLHLNLIIVEGGDVVDAPKLTLEVCDEWFRVYVKGNTPADRVAEFLRTVDDEYGIDVMLPNE